MPSPEELRIVAEALFEAGVLPSGIDPLKFASEFLGEPIPETEDELLISEEPEPAEDA